MNLNSLLEISAFSPKSLRDPNAWMGHLPFAAWIIREVSPKVFVELGTHSGNSYFSFCQSVVEGGLSSKCFAVDTWQGDEHAGHYDDDVFIQVNAHHQQNYAHFSRLLRMPFNEAVSYFSDESIDLLHIDGLHTYEAVTDDFETWLPKLAPGAVVLFHDTNVRERNFGVWKLWEELQVIYPGNLEFVHSHGLGVLQLNNAPAQKKLPWLQPDFPEKQDLINYFAALGSRQPERYDLSLVKSQVANLAEVLAGRDSQVKSLNGLLVERDSQVKSLNGLLVERDSQVKSLNGLLVERDSQVKSLNQIIAERDDQIANTLVERDTAIRNFFEIRRSHSWRLTAPLRFFGHLVKGDFNLAGNVVREVGCRLMRLLSKGPASLVRRNYGRLMNVLAIMPNSSSNYPAIAAIVTQRNIFTFEALTVDPLSPPEPQAWAKVDISIVTYNSSQWINNFVNSLIELDYPKKLLTVRFIDNSSTDSTLNDLQAIAPLLRAAGYTVEITQQPNKGYGAGHNTAIVQGIAPFCLVTNIDIIFEPDSLRRIVAVALADHEHTAGWELRQKPYEHPKFYDAITGITNWNSHACVLLRRNALDQVGLYDGALFMYGEDVELSYRLRRAGYLLRYCPQAVVWHYSYESADQIKPIQYIGSTFANLYLRLKYGNYNDACSVPMLGLRLLIAPETYPGSRIAVLRSLLKLVVVTPKALFGRRCSSIHFPFRTWDYDLNREGAFVKQYELPTSLPLVSIITRTFRGRELFLRQALLSVSHQTYPNVEHIVVEDGGMSMRPVVDNIIQTTGHDIQFIPIDKMGRSAAGNAGLSIAKGRWCLFLDDDDLLFSEHIEVLVNTLLANVDAVAAYSLAWEVPTDSSRLADGEYSECSHKVPSALNQEFDYAVLKHHNFMPIQSVLFERTLFEERGGLEEDMDALEDWVLWKKYASNNRFVLVRKVTSLYRVPTEPAIIAQRMASFNLAYPLALSRHSKYVNINEAPQ
jgi:GT2 family glycosyltransferase